MKKVYVLVVLLVLLVAVSAVYADVPHAAASAGGSDVSFVTESHLPPVSPDIFQPIDTRVPPELNCPTAGFSGEGCQAPDTVEMTLEQIERRYGG